MKFKLIIFMLGILIIHTNTVSAISSCSVNPNNLWIDANTNVWLTKDYINVTCTCSSGSTAWSNITDSNNNFVGQITLDDISSTLYNGYTLLDGSLSPGTYNVISYCNSETENETKTFTINKLGARLISSSSSLVYPNDILTLKVEFELNNEMITSTTKTDFQIFLDNIPITIQNVPSPNIVGGYWEIKVKVPDSFTNYGNYNFIINATYDFYTITLISYDYIKVEPLIKLDIISPSVLSPYKLTGMQDLEIKAKALYKSQLITEFDFPDFEVKLNNDLLTIKEINYDENKWNLLVNIPKLSAREASYYLDVYIEHNGIQTKSSKPLPIQFLLSLKGTLLNAEGTPIKNAEIELKGSNLEEKCITNSTGAYQLGIPPGNYDLKLIFPEMQAEFSNVEISSDEIYSGLASDFIQYDYYTGDIKTDDIEAKKIVVLEFALTFDSAHIIIPYSDSKFTNEDDLNVFKCKDWNLGKRSCLGEWEKIDVTIDNIRNIISFDVSDLSAFAIGEKQDLKLELNLDKETYYLGEKINLNGKVVDNNQKGMSDIEIIYSISNTEIDGTTNTNSNGDFSTSFNAPNEEGNFEIKIRAKKLPYLPIDKTISFKTQKKKELNINVISSVDIKLNQSKQVAFTIENTGQRNESNINIYIKGISPDWYKLNLEKIDKLEINEEKTIRLNLTIPSKQCEMSHCDSEYTVEIKAKNSETTSSKTFKLRIEGLISKETLEQTKEENSTISGFLNQTITGFAIVASSNSTKYLLIIIFAGVAIFFVKKRRVFNKKESRVLVTHTLNKIKEETLRGNAINKENSYEYKRKKMKKSNFIKNVLINPFKRK